MMRSFIFLASFSLGGSLIGYIWGLAARDCGRQRPHEWLAAWRFRRRFPIGCRVRITGTCCDTKHRDEVHVVRRHIFSDRWEVRFDLPYAQGQPSPAYGCCAGGIERVRR